MDHCESMDQWINESLSVAWCVSTVKRCVVKAVLQVSKLTESRTAAGMLFQTAGAKTAKECLWKSKEAWGRCKMIEAPERNVLDGWWRCIHSPDSPGHQCGMWIALNVMVPSLNSTRWRIGSQCNCRRSSVALVRWGVCVTARASEFWTRWRRSRLRCDVQLCSILIIF